MWCIVGLNVACAALPPYTWLNVLNGVCAVALGATLIAVREEF